MREVFSYSTCELIILLFNFLVICNQNFERAYLKTTFGKLIDKFINRNLSVRMAYSRYHFVQNFCCYGTMWDFFKSRIVFIAKKAMYLPILLFFEIKQSPT